MKAKRDEPLEEIWAIRRRIAERYGYDPQKQARDLQKRQQREKARLFRREDTISTSK